MDTCPRARLRIRREAKTFIFMDGISGGLGELIELMGFKGLLEGFGRFLGLEEFGNYFN